MFPRVVVIVLVWNGGRFLDACLSSLLSQDYSPFQVIVVDNASTDDSVAIAQKYAPPVQLIRNDYNYGYAGGNNVGLQAAGDADVLVLLNQDTVAQPGWLSAIAETFGDPAVGIVGCKALYPDGRSLQHAGALVYTDDALTRHIGWGEADTGQYDTVTDSDYVTGAAFALQRRVLERLGGLDEQYYPAFYEEIDYCYRARRAGWRVVYQPRAVIYHYETVSLPEESYGRVSAYHRNRVRFVLRHWEMDALEKFAAAERHAIEITIGLDDLVARARAYWDNMLALPVIVLQRSEDVTLGGPLTHGKVRWLMETLQAFRQQAHQRIAALIADPNWRPQPQASSAEDLPMSPVASFTGGNEPLDSGRQGTALIHLLEKAQDRVVLVEPTLESKVPVLGPVITRFRAFWISLVVRHYLLPILSQQSGFNAEMVRLNAQLVRLEQGNRQLLQILTADDAAILNVLQTLVDDRERR